MVEFDIKKAEELEQKYDSGLHTRAVGPWLVKFSFVFSILFAAYHYITAGIGVPVDYWHMGVHMSGVILLPLLLSVVLLPFFFDPAKKLEKNCLILFVCLTECAEER